MLTQAASSHHHPLDPCTPPSPHKQLLRGWSGLSRPVRMRVVWVTSHYLRLPAALDESWETLFKALTDTMSRSGPALRLHDLMASASLGTLFQSERQVRLRALMSVCAGGRSVWFKVNQGREGKAGRQAGPPSADSHSLPALAPTAHDPPPSSFSPGRVTSPSSLTWWPLQRCASGRSWSSAPSSPAWLACRYELLWECGVWGVKGGE